MDHPEECAVFVRSERVDFDHQVRLEFLGSQLSSDGGLLVTRELDGAIGLFDLVTTSLADPDPITRVQPHRFPFGSA